MSFYRDCFILSCCKRISIPILVNAESQRGVSLHTRVRTRRIDRHFITRDRNCILVNRYVCVLCTDLHGCIRNLAFSSRYNEFLGCCFGTSVLISTLDYSIQRLSNEADRLSVNRYTCWNLEPCCMTISICNLYIVSISILYICTYGSCIRRFQ